MKEKLSKSTEIAAYFLWEYTNHPSALNLWYCAEDIGFFLEKKELIENESIYVYTRKPKDDPMYIAFVRQIAYRIFIFTNDIDHLKNWFAAEKLVANGEWIAAIAKVAKFYSLLRDGNTEVADSIRSDRIKRQYIL